MKQPSAPPRRKTAAGPRPSGARAPAKAGQPIASLEGALAALAARVSALEGHGPRQLDEQPLATPRSKLWLLDGLHAALPAGQGGVAYGGRFAVPGGGELLWQIGRTQDDLLDEDWTDLAPRLAALAHPVRLQLLKSLLTGATSAQQLQALPRLGTTGQLYHHLRELEAGGWIVSAQRGRYEVASARVVALLAVLAAARQ